MTRPAPGRFGRLERDLHGWLGEKALQEGLITAAQLDECLRECPDASARSSCARDISKRTNWPGC